MKNLVQKSIVSIASTIILSWGMFNYQAKAASFDETEVDQNRVAAIAVPRLSGGYQLLILEQLSDLKQCWSETGSRPTIVDPLLLEFDFTGICGRATDSNGYSIRMGGTDLGLIYTLSVQTNGSEVLLVASSITRSGNPIIIGKTYGMSNGFMKIILEPGWRLTKRTYQGKVLGHFYFTSNQAPPNT